MEPPIASALPQSSSNADLSHPTDTHSLVLGFLTILQDVTGWIGGYLVTNGWGRPLEFRLTTAVQPNRVQRALYGPTLQEYVFADLIGKTLVEKTGIVPSLLITDVPLLLSLRSRVHLPIVAVPPSDSNGTMPSGCVSLEHPRCRTSLWLPSCSDSEVGAIRLLLDQVDPAVELSEPFSRIREAVAEARKLGASSRAA